MNSIRGETTRLGLVQSPGCDNEVVTKLTHVAAPPCVPVIRSGRYVDSALFVQAEVKSDDWNASWRHQANGALSDNPIGSSSQASL